MVERAQAGFFEGGEEPTTPPTPVPAVGVVDYGEVGPISTNNASIDNPVELATPTPSRPGIPIATANAAYITLCDAQNRSITSVNIRIYGTSFSRVSYDTRRVCTGDGVHRLAPTCLKRLDAGISYKVEIAHCAQNQRNNTRDRLTGSYIVLAAPGQ